MFNHHMSRYFHPLTDCLLVLQRNQIVEFQVKSLLKTRVTECLLDLIPLHSFSPIYLLIFPILIENVLIHFPTLLSLSSPLSLTAIGCRQDRWQIPALVNPGSSLTAEHSQSEPTKSNTFGKEKTRSVRLHRVWSGPVDRRRLQFRTTVDRRMIWTTVRPTPWWSSWMQNPA